MIVNAGQGVRNMLNPTFRLFIIPLGAICTLASMSAQNAPRVQRDGQILIRQQVIDCSALSPADVCVISHDDRTSR
jgi:hypothetical protein